MSRKNALFKWGRGGNAMITEKYRKLRKGFTSVGARSQKTVEVNSRTGYQWANSTTNDSCYSPSVYYVRSILNTFALIFTEVPWCKSFPFYWWENRVSEKPVKLKGSMNFQSGYEESQSPCSSHYHQKAGWPTRLMNYRVNVQKCCSPEATLIFQHQMVYRLETESRASNSFQLFLRFSSAPQNIQTPSYKFLRIQKILTWASYNKMPELGKQFQFTTLCSQ